MEYEEIPRHIDQTRTLWLGCQELVSRFLLSSSSHALSLAYTSIVSLSISYNVSTALAMMVYLVKGVSPPPLHPLWGVLHFHCPATDPRRGRVKAGRTSLALASYLVNDRSAQRSRAVPAKARVVITFRLAQRASNRKRSAWSVGQGALRVPEAKTFRREIKEERGNAIDVYRSETSVLACF